MSARPLGGPAPGFGLALWGLLAIGWAASAAGHTRSESFSTWRLDGPRIAVVFTVSAHRATLLSASAAPLAARLARHLAATLTVHQGPSACAATSPRPLPAAPGYLRQRIEFICPADVRLRPTQITVGAFFDHAAGHVHLARVEDGPGGGFERVLDGERAAFAIPPRAPAGGDGLGDVLALGFTHVLGGPDHLAFLAALLLACVGVRALIGVVTAFTIGHSLSLALVVLGRIEPHGPSVEALIGASIALVACEALAARRPMPRRLPLALAGGLIGAMLVARGLGVGALPPPVWLGLAAFVGLPGLATAPGRAPRSGWALAMAFGLVHGAGFADALRALALDGPALLAGLLAFNVGVELGQLAVVVPLWLLGVAVARRAGPAGVRLAAPTAAGLVGLGVFWFVERALGG